MASEAKQSRFTCACAGRRDCFGPPRAPRNDKCKTEVRNDPMQIGHNRKKMTGAQCLADMLKGYGVTHVFHVPAVLRTTYAEMERRTDIKRLHVHGEKSAAYMADGYARASGKPGICMAQVIGALNLAAGLRDA